MRLYKRQAGEARRGSTLIEVTFSAAILSVLLLALFGVLEREGQLGRSTLAIAVAENRAIELSGRLRRELVGARGKRVRCVLTQPLSAGESGPDSEASVSTTTGFPPAGALLVDSDSLSFERIAYAGLDAGERTFQELARGLGGTGQLLGVVHLIQRGRQIGFCRVQIDAAGGQQPLQQRTPVAGLMAIGLLPAACNSSHSARVAAREADGTWPAGQSSGGQVKLVP